MRPIVEQAKAADDEMGEDERNLQEAQTNKRKGPHAAKTKNAPASSQPRSATGTEAWGDGCLVVHRG